jgi:exopolyphosphatase/guanosine-5'-triphosphate,3'-diphosphate pyrophosphatase
MSFLPMTEIAPLTTPDVTPFSPRRKLGVIDIGSNSLRLVVYDIDVRVPFQIFNEKVLSALGKGVSKSGKLNPDGWESAQNAIRRFCALAQEMRVAQLIAVATAAVRDAEDGAKFVEEVEASCNIRIRVLSGEEEARYSALGVVAGIRAADGIVGDMGGGSLELVDIFNDQPKSGVTMPFGPLRLIDQYGSNISKASKEVASTLKSMDWLKAGKGRAFYAVGGAWRALAKAHIQKTGYPLNILHNYQLPTEEALALCKELSGMTESEISSAYSSVSNRRIQTLPHAAMVLTQVIEAVKPSEIVISGFGLREGLAFEQMFEDGQAPDLLIEMCQELARTRGRFGDHGDEIEEWIAPIFPDMTEKQARNRHAACLLSDIGWAGHPDYRAEVVLQDVLHSQLVGISHQGRAFIAQALYICYGGKADKSPIKSMSPDISDDAMKKAEILGLVLRLAQRISGGTEGILAKCDLKIDGDKVILQVPSENAHLVSEVVERRLKNLAGAMGLGYAIES